MVKYDWKIYPYVDNIFTSINTQIGRYLNAYGLLETSEMGDGQTFRNTTDFIPVNPSAFGSIRITSALASTPIYPYISFYNSSKQSLVVSSYTHNGENFAYYYDEIADQQVSVQTNVGRIEFATARGWIYIPDGAAYMRISADGRYWDAVHIETFGERTDANPIYKDDLALSYEVEGKNRFLRRKLSGNLTFIRNDFDNIMSYDADTNVRVVLRKSVNNGTYTDYWEGEFSRTDCHITYDDKRIVVAPDVTDTYKSIIDRYEDEYNLIDLAPEIERVTYVQRPKLQLYVWLQGVVQAVVGGMVWEEDCNDPNTESSLTSTYHFTLMDGGGKEIEISSTTYPAIAGNYLGTMPTPEYNPESSLNTFTKIATMTASDGRYFTYSVQYFDSSTTSHYDYRYIFYDANGNELARVLAESTSLSREWDMQRWELDTILTSNNITFKCVQSLRMYARYLTNMEGSGSSFNDIPLDDPFVDANNNYKYIYTPQSNLLSALFVSTQRYTNVPTKYGRVEESVEKALNAGETTAKKYYYLPPDDDAYYVPVSQSTWGANTFWLDMTSVTSSATINVENSLQQSVVLNDAFPFHSCIDVLAKRIDPRLSFSNTTEYSNFLYAATNPVTQVTNNPFRHLYITQITNISRGEYTQAAQKGEATLKWFLDLVKNAFNCFWWVDSDFKIHIEHISWFENGASYTSGTQETGIDLTAIMNNRNKLSWSFSLGECTFETDDVASRYQYEWSMGGRELFNGNAVEMLNRNIDKSKKEEVSVSHFATDLDYIIANPSEFSNDGWILLATHLLQNKYIVRFSYVKFGEYKKTGGEEDYLFAASNGELSFAYLQPRFLTYGLPYANISCNGEVTTAKSLARMQTQQVTIPYGDSEVETDKLVVTSVGSGQIKRAVFELSSRTAKVTLKYPVN